METHAQKNSYREMFLRTIAVLGLIAVLLIGAWGIIQLAVSIPSFFSNIGSGVSTAVSTTQKESLTVSQASTLSSGQTLQVAWTHANKNGDYSYTLSYACQTGLSLKAPAPNGSYQTVACNTPFDFVNATQHMSVIATLTGSTAKPLMITVEATKLSSGAVTASGAATTNINPSVSAVAPAKTTTPAPAVKAPAATKGTTYTYYPAMTRAALYGYPDLVVRVVSVVPQNNSLVAMQFSIENDGTNVANAGWTFNANLPINGSYIYNSPAQQALNPGDKIIYTLTFTRPQNYNTYPNQYNYSYGYTASGYTCNGYTCNNNTIGYNIAPTNYGYTSGTATVTVDPYTQVYELNKANNFINIAI